MWCIRALLLPVLLCPLPGGGAAAADTVTSPAAAVREVVAPPAAGKPVVYQLFTRLFGNRQTRNRPWGTIEENGVGKFNDINDAALRGIRELGVTHVWYTGVPHHAVIRDYRRHGISDDDPDVVKGRAGSPYAVKDYYSVDPDLAEDPAQRLEEFVALIERTHARGMRVIIDIVPNHVARGYQSLARPAGVEDFGAGDDSSVTYRRDNNFYYVLGESFKVPDFGDGPRPLGGEPHPLADGGFVEHPARWTGNGSRLAQPDADDWYETIRINFGVRPDGSFDFPRLPSRYAELDVAAHAAFWRDKNVPDSWKKFRSIAIYWLELGVDGFRYDMAGMVPVEFWSYLNSSIKQFRPDAFLLAELYEFDKYRDYIHLGKMDYLYNKVELYDTLKAVIQGRASTDAIGTARELLADIDDHMLTFLENHDEQRIASPDFAGDADRARPAMVVTATLGAAPTMIYFGQEVGEPAAGDAGYGRTSRTTIFDYWGVPAHQRWMNGGKFDGGALRPAERSLREFYRQLLQYTARAPVLRGEFVELHGYNRNHGRDYGERVYSFARWSDDQRLLVVANFDPQVAVTMILLLPPELLRQWGLGDGDYATREALTGTAGPVLTVDGGIGRLRCTLRPLESLLLETQP